MTFKKQNLYAYRNCHIYYCSVQFSAKNIQMSKKKNKDMTLVKLNISVNDLINI